MAARSRSFTRSCAHASGPVDAVALPLALYVHLPWCVRKCPYCDFNSHALHAAVDRRRYAQALVRDFERELPQLAGRPLESVFFGGGTPSLFTPDEIGRLIESFAARHPLARDAEITLEANPGTIERGRFAEYRGAGVNRVSLGAQSFTARALERLGRIHSPAETHRAVEELNAAGLTNFNLDLMYALPEQTLAEAIADVESACALEPAHLSHYQLTLEPGTVFHARPPRLPDEDLAWQMQLECQAALARAGYAQYEVSAYARPGAECRHNLNYWRFGDYVGVGAGAHGKITVALPDAVWRTAKPRSPREYEARPDPGAATAGQAGPGDAASGEAAFGDSDFGERRIVPRRDLPFEFMLNALRLNRGFYASEFEKRTGLPMAEVRGTLEQVAERGLVEPGEGAESGEQWRPTALGRRFLNDLQAAFLA